ncbi:hypothetical protein FHT82_003478 [Rhizobium sp. BK275]|uniref:hypothetical protein n=1 Tax=Rhizobium sp. BK316 TaxID=2587053 RepID=UPI0017A78D13|nr:hypothetical protein [Rhizobium sp. BK316]MBB3390706.1 hypothetical protein [Rhizobium sp. BK275]MBB3406513.1 hypothetical protein [Rhizobium sp. BK316]
MRADRKSKSRKETRTENSIRTDSTGKPLVDVITSHLTGSKHHGHGSERAGLLCRRVAEDCPEGCNGEYGRAVGPERSNAIVDTYLASSFYPNGPLAENVKAISRLDEAKS